MLYILAILRQSCIFQNSPPAYRLALLTLATHSPKSGMWSLFLLPFSEHLQSFSGSVSRPIALNVLNLHLWQLQTSGNNLPLRKTLSQLDQVSINTRTIKELSRELWQLLLKAKRAGNHMRYTSFRHFKTVSNKKKTCVTCSDRDVAFSVTPPLIFAFKMPLYSNNVWGWTRSRGT